MMFNKIPPAMQGMVNLSYPKRPGNLFWMTSYLAAETFFVCATVGAADTCGTLTGCGTVQRGSILHPAPPVPVRSLLPAPQFFFLMVGRARVPRWTLIVAWAQCGYNMKNDLMWVPLGKLMSPVGKPIYAFIGDFLLIGSLFVVYIHHFFTADAVAP